MSDSRLDGAEEIFDLETLLWERDSALAQYDHAKKAREAEKHRQLRMEQHRQLQMEMTREWLGGRPFTPEVVMGLLEVDRQSVWMDRVPGVRFAKDVEELYEVYDEALDEASRRLYEEGGAWGVVGIGIDVIRAVENLLAFGWDLWTAADRDEDQILPHLVGAWKDHVFGNSGSIFNSIGEPDTGLGRIFAVTPGWLDPVGHKLLGSWEWGYENFWQKGVVSPIAGYVTAGYGSYSRTKDLIMNPGQQGWLGQRAGWWDISGLPSLFMEAVEDYNLGYGLHQHGRKVVRYDGEMVRIVDVDTALVKFDNAEDAKRSGALGNEFFDVESQQWVWSVRLADVSGPERAKGPDGFYLDLDKQMLAQAQIMEQAVVGSPEWNAANVELSRLKDEAGAWAEEAGEAPGGDWMAAELAMMYPPGTRISIGVAGQDTFAEGERPRILGWISKEDHDINDWLINSGSGQFDNYGLSPGESPEMAAINDDGMSLGQIVMGPIWGHNPAHAETWDWAEVDKMLRNPAFQAASGTVDFIKQAAGESVFELGVLKVFGLARRGAVVARVNRRSTKRVPIPDIHIPGPNQRGSAAHSRGIGRTMRVPRTEPDVTLIPRWMQRASALNATPTRALWARTNRGFGVWVRLTPQEMNQAGLLQTKRWINSRAFQRMDGEIQQVFDRQNAELEDLRGTPAYDEALARRMTTVRETLTGNRPNRQATDIPGLRGVGRGTLTGIRDYLRRTYGLQKAPDPVVRALALGSTPQMRRNHLLLMMGDDATLRAAQRSLHNFSQLLLDALGTEGYQRAKGLRADLRGHHAATRALHNRHKAAKARLEKEMQAAQVRKDSAKPFVYDGPDEVGMPGFEERYAEAVAAYEAGLEAPFTTARERFAAEEAAIQSELMETRAEARKALSEISEIENKLAEDFRPRFPEEDMQFDLEFMVEGIMPYQRGTVRREGLSWRESVDLDIAERAAESLDFPVLTGMLDRWQVRSMMMTLEHPHVLDSLGRYLNSQERRWAETEVAKPWRGDEPPDGEPDISPPSPPPRQPDGAWGTAPPRADFDPPPETPEPTDVGHTAADVEEYLSDSVPTSERTPGPFSDSGEGAWWSDIWETQAVGPAPRTPTLDVREVHDLLGLGPPRYLPGEPPPWPGHIRLRRGSDPGGIVDSPRVGEPVFFAFAEGPLGGVASFYAHKTGGGEAARIRRGGIVELFDIPIEVVMDAVKVPEELLPRIGSDQAEVEAGIAKLAAEQGKPEAPGLVVFDGGDVATFGQLAIVDRGLTSRLSHRGVYTSRALEGLARGLGLRPGQPMYQPWRNDLDTEAYVRATGDEKPKAAWDDDADPFDMSLAHAEAVRAWQDRVVRWHEERWGERNPPFSSAEYRRRLQAERKYGKRIPSDPAEYDAMIAEVYGGRDGLESSQGGAGDDLFVDPATDPFRMMATEGVDAGKPATPSLNKVTRDDGTIMGYEIMVDGVEVGVVSKGAAGRWQPGMTDANGQRRELGGSVKTRKAAVELVMEERARMERAEGSQAPTPEAPQPDAAPLPPDDISKRMATQAEVSVRAWTGRGASPEWVDQYRRLVGRIADGTADFERVARTTTSTPEEAAALKARLGAEPGTADRLGWMRHLDEWAARRTERMMKEARAKRRKQGDPTPEPAPEGTVARAQQDLASAPVDRSRPWTLFVAGGRKFRDKRLAWHSFWNEVAARGSFPTRVVHGGAQGADKIAGDWVRHVNSADNGIEIIDGADPTTSQEWNWYGTDERGIKQAAFVRNARMAHTLAELAPNEDIVAFTFAGGNGTAEMRQLLDDKGIAWINPGADPARSGYPHVRNEANEISKNLTAFGASDELVREFQAGTKAILEDPLLTPDAMRDEIAEAGMGALAEVAGLPAEIKQGQRLRITNPEAEWFGVKVAEVLKARPDYDAEKWGRVGTTKLRKIENDWAVDAMARRADAIGEGRQLGPQAAAEDVARLGEIIAREAGLDDARASQSLPSGATKAELEELVPDRYDENGAQVALSGDAAVRVNPDEHIASGIWVGGEAPPGRGIDGPAYSAWRNEYLEAAGESGVEVSRATEELALQLYIDERLADPKFRRHVIHLAGKALYDEHAIGMGTANPDLSHAYFLADMARAAHSNELWAAAAEFWSLDPVQRELVKNPELRDRIDRQLLEESDYDLGDMSDLPESRQDPKKWLGGGGDFVFSRTVLPGRDKAVMGSSGRRAVGGGGLLEGSLTPEGTIAEIARLEEWELEYGKPSDRMRLMRWVREGRAIREIARERAKRLIDEAEVDKAVDNGEVAAITHERTLRKKLGQARFEVTRDRSTPRGGAISTERLSRDAAVIHTARKEVMRRGGPWQEIVTREQAEAQLRQLGLADLIRQADGNPRLVIEAVETVGGGQAERLETVGEAIDTADAELLAQERQRIIARIEEATGRTGARELTTQDLMDLFESGGRQVEPEVRADPFDAEAISLRMREVQRLADEHAKAHERLMEFAEAKKVVADTPEMRGLIQAVADAEGEVARLNAEIEELLPEAAWREPPPSDMEGVPSRPERFLDPEGSKEALAAVAERRAEERRAALQGGGKGASFEPRPPLEVRTARMDLAGKERQLIDAVSELAQARGALRAATRPETGERIAALEEVTHQEVQRLLGISHRVGEQVAEIEGAIVRLGYDLSVGPEQRLVSVARYAEMDAESFLGEGAEPSVAESFSGRGAGQHIPDVDRPLRGTTEDPAGYRVGAAQEDLAADYIEGTGGFAPEQREGETSAEYRRRLNPEGKKRRPRRTELEPTSLEDAEKLQAEAVAGSDRRDPVGPPIPRHLMDPEVFMHGRSPYEFTEGRGFEMSDEFARAYDAWVREANWLTSYFNIGEGASPYVTTAYLRGLNGVDWAADGEAIRSILEAKLNLVRDQQAEWQRSGSPKGRRPALQIIMVDEAHHRLAGEVEGAMRTIRTPRRDPETGQLETTQKWNVDTQAEETRTVYDTEQVPETEMVTGEYARGDTDMAVVTASRTVARIARWAKSHGVRVKVVNSLRTDPYLMGETFDKATRPGDATGEWLLGMVRGTQEVIDFQGAVSPPALRNREAQRYKLPSSEWVPPLGETPERARLQQAEAAFEAVEMELRQLLPDDDRTDVLARREAAVGERVAARKALEARQLAEAQQAGRLESEPPPARGDVSPPAERRPRITDEALEEQKAEAAHYRREGEIGFAGDFIPVTERLRSEMLGAAYAGAVMNELLHRLGLRPRARLPLAVTNPLDRAEVVVKDIPPGEGQLPMAVQGSTTRPAMSSHQAAVNKDILALQDMPLDGPHGLKALAAELSPKTFRKFDPTGLMDKVHQFVTQGTDSVAKAISADRAQFGEAPVTVSGRLEALLLYEELIGGDAKSLDLWDEPHLLSILDPEGEFLPEAQARRWRQMDRGRAHGRLTDVEGAVAAELETGGRADSYDADPNDLESGDALGEAETNEARLGMSVDRSGPPPERVPGGAEVQRIFGFEADQDYMNAVVANAWEKIEEWGRLWIRDATPEQLASMRKDQKVPRSWLSLTSSEEGLLRIEHRRAGMMVLREIKPIVRDMVRLAEGGLEVADMLEAVEIQPGAMSGPARSALGWRQSHVAEMIGMSTEGFKDLLKAQREVDKRRAEAEREARAEEAALAEEEARAQAMEDPELNRQAELEALIAEQRVDDAGRDFDPSDMSPEDLARMEAAREEAYYAEMGGDFYDAVGEEGIFVDPGTDDLQASAVPPREREGALRAEMQRLTGATELTARDMDYLSRQHTRAYNQVRGDAEVTPRVREAEAAMRAARRSESADDMRAAVAELAEARGEHLEMLGESPQPSAAPPKSSIDARISELVEERIEAAGGDTLEAIRLASPHIAKDTSIMGAARNAMERAVLRASKRYVGKRQYSHRPTTPSETKLRGLAVAAALRAELGPEVRGVLLSELLMARARRAVGVDERPALARVEEKLDVVLDEMTSGGEGGDRLFNALNNDPAEVLREGRSWLPGESREADIERGKSDSMYVFKHLGELADWDGIRVTVQIKRGETPDLGIAADLEHQLSLAFADLFRGLDKQATYFAGYAADWLIAAAARGDAADMIHAANANAALFRSLPENVRALWALTEQRKRHWEDVANGAKGTPSPITEAEVEAMDVAIAEALDGEQLPRREPSLYDLAEEMDNQLSVGQTPLASVPVLEDAVMAVEALGNAGLASELREMIQGPKRKRGKSSIAEADPGAQVIGSHEEYLDSPFIEPDVDAQDSADWMEPPDPSRRRELPPDFDQSHPVARELAEAIRVRGDMEYLFRAPARRRAAEMPSKTDEQIVEIASPTFGQKWLINNWTEMVPQRVIRFDDPVQSTRQFERVLRDAARMGKWLTSDGSGLSAGEWKSLLDAQEMGEYITRWNATANADDKQAFFNDVLNEIFERIEARLGLGADGLALRLDHVWKETEGILKRRPPSGGRFTASDTTTVNYRDGDTIHRLDIPLSQSQLQESTMLPRFDLIEEALRKAHREGRLADVDEPATTAQDAFHAAAKVGHAVDDVAGIVMDVWRPIVLLKAAWPAKITLEEQFRVLSMFEVLDVVKNVIKGTSSYRVALLQRHGIDVPGEAVRSMAGELGVEVINDYDVILKARELHGEQWIEDHFEKAVNDQWGRLRQSARVLGHGFAGWLAAGPLGTLSATGLALKGKSKVARKLGLEEAGRTVGPIFEAESAGLLREAELEAQGDPVEAARAAAMRMMAERMRIEGIRATEAAKMLALDEVPEAFTLQEQAQEWLGKAGLADIKIGNQPVPAAFGSSPGHSDVLKAGASASRGFGRIVTGSERVHPSDAPQADWTRYILRNTDDKTWRQAWWRRANMQFRVRDPDNEWGRVLTQIYRTDFDTHDEWYDNVYRTLTETREGGVIMRRLELPDHPDAVRNWIENQHREGTNALLPHYLQDQNTGEWTTLPQFLASIGANSTRDFTGLRRALVEGREINWGQVEEIRESWGASAIASVDMATKMDIVAAPGPDVHTGQLGKVETFRDNMMEVLGSLPTDHLSRFPTYRLRYQADMQRRLAAYYSPDLGNYVISLPEMERLAARSRVRALEDVRHYLYDLSESSRYEEMLKNYIPFMGAWHEVLSRWGGIAVDNPLYVAWVLEQINEVATAEDQHGNPVALIHVPSAKELPFGEYLSWAATTGPKAGILWEAASMGALQIDPNSVFTFGMTPAVGPPVAYPLGNWVATRPALMERLGWMFAHGIPQGESGVARFMEAFGASHIHRVMEAVSDYSSNQMNRMEAQVARMTAHLLWNQPAPKVLVDGKWVPSDYGNMLDYMWGDKLRRQELLRAVGEKANEWATLRAIVSLASPVRINVSLDIDPMVAEFRRMQEQHDDHVAGGGEPYDVGQRFLNKHGPELLFALTPITRSFSGVGATIEAEKAMGRFMEVSDRPEMNLRVGQLVSGMLAPGALRHEWDPLVASAQMSRGERGVLSAEDVIQNLVSGQQRRKAGIAIEERKAVEGGVSEDTAAAVADWQRSTLESESQMYARAPREDGTAAQADMWRDLRLVVGTRTERGTEADMVQLKAYLEMRVDYEKRVRDLGLTAIPEKSRLNQREILDLRRDWDRAVWEFRDGNSVFEPIYQEFFLNDNVHINTHYDSGTEILEDFNVR